MQDFVSMWRRVFTEKWVSSYRGCSQFWFVTTVLLWVPCCRCFLVRKSQRNQGFAKIFPMSMSVNTKPYMCRGSGVGSKGSQGRTQESTQLHSCVWGTSLGAGKKTEELQRGTLMSWLQHSLPIPHSGNMR